MRNTLGGRDDVTKDVSCLKPDCMQRSTSVQGSGIFLAMLGEVSTELSMMVLFE